MTKVPYDIHIDAEEISPQCEAYVIEKLGFQSKNFIHEYGVIPYQPKRHLSYHPKDGKEFKKVFGLLKQYLNQHPEELMGYVEGEFIAFDENIEYKPFNSSVNMPFRIRLEPLPPGRFRESEIHISFIQKGSDKRLGENLSAMGLFVSYLPKKDGVAEVYTLQGSRRQINFFLPLPWAYLLSAGGGKGCSVKEERTVDWWMSPGAQLPPVIEQSSWVLSSIWD